VTKVTVMTCEHKGTGGKQAFGMENMANLGVVNRVLGTESSGSLDGGLCSATLPCYRGAYEEACCRPSLQFIFKE
jgi:hypothetical protein